MEGRWLKEMQLMADGFDFKLKEAAIDRFPSMGDEIKVWKHRPEAQISWSS